MRRARVIGIVGLLMMGCGPQPAGSGAMGTGSTTGSTSSTSGGPGCGPTVTCPSGYDCYDGTCEPSCALADDPAARCSTTDPWPEPTASTSGPDLGGFEPECQLDEDCEADEYCDDGRCVWVCGLAGGGHPARCGTTGETTGWDDTSTGGPDTSTSTGGDTGTSG